MILTIIAFAFGVFGVAYGIRSYYELWKWARQCQHARIAIAYKGKVKSDAPLIEWLLWANMIDKDKGSNGRVIYQINSTRVAIIKASHAKFTLRQFFREMRIGLRGFAKQAKPTRHHAPQVREGKWSATDQTPSKNHLEKEAIT